MFSLFTNLYTLNTKFSNDEYDNNFTCLERATRLKSVFAIKSPKMIRKKWSFSVNALAVVHPFTLYCYTQQQWMTFEPKKYLGLHLDGCYFRLCRFMVQTNENWKISFSIHGEHWVFSI